MSQSKPSVPTIQSLSPKSLTGSVLPPVARTASVAIPPAAGRLRLPHTPGPEENRVEMGVLEKADPVLAAAPPASSAFLDYWRKVGGGSLTISLLVHAVLISVFVAIVTVTVHEPKVDFLPGGGSAQGADASRDLAHQVQQKKRTMMNKSTPMRKVVIQGDAAITLPDVPIDALDAPDMAIPLAMSGGFGSVGAGGGHGAGLGMGGRGGAAFTSLPPSMKSRCSPPERMQKLKESGGKPECEKAVSAALEYLRTKQNADGSWGDDYRAGMTGFALLCYFGRCETPDSVFYGENVMKGILYLIELSKKNGGMMATSRSTGAVYEHGIATYALGEMYALARLGSKTLPGMREAFESGVKLIIKNQLPTGGWSYKTLGGNYSRSGASDPSVTGWHYQALKAAKLSGLNIAGLTQSIDKAMKYLASIQTKDGGFGEPNREAMVYTQWTMTGVAVLGLQTLGHGEQQQIKRGIRFAYDYYQKEKPEWKNANLYAWYYVAQMFFQNGGVEWKFWNENALPAILEHQEKDGRWVSPTDNLGANYGGNDIYSTALCTLMLEVYYRYLKVGDREEISVFDRGR